MYLFNKLNPELMNEATPVDPNYVSIRIRPQGNNFRVAVTGDDPDREIYVLVHDTEGELETHRLEPYTVQMRLRVVIPATGGQGFDSLEGAQAVLEEAKAAWDLAHKLED